MVENFKGKSPYILLILYTGLVHTKGFKQLFHSPLEFGIFHLEVSIFFLSICALFMNRVLTIGGYWIVLATFLLIELVFKRLHAANSSYLYAYFMIAFALSFKGKAGERKAFWGNSSRLLLFVAFFYAGLQKTFSLFYVEGNLMTGLHMQKGMFHWLLTTYERCFPEAVINFSQAYQTAREQPPQHGLEVPVEIPENVFLLSRLMSIPSIILEFSIACLCLSKASYHWVGTFILSLAVVLGVYTLVNEVEFLALICLLSYFGQECKGWKAHFFLGASLYFILVDALNYRPFFLG